MQGHLSSFIRQTKEKREQEKIEADKKNKFRDDMLSILRSMLEKKKLLLL